MSESFCPPGVASFPTFSRKVAAGEKDHRAVRIDALDPPGKRMGSGIGEKGENLALILARLHGSPPWIGRSARATARRKKGGAKIAPPHSIGNYSAAASFCVDFLASPAPLAEAFVVLNPYHRDDTASVQSDPKTTFFTDDYLRLEARRRIIYLPRYTKRLPDEEKKFMELPSRP